jgi:hypothetical protein
MTCAGPVSPRLAVHRKWCGMKGLFGASFALKITVMPAFAVHMCTRPFCPPAAGKLALAVTIILNILSHNIPWASSGLSVKLHAEQRRVYLRLYQHCHTTPQNGGMTPPMPHSSTSVYTQLQSYIKCIAMYTLSHSTPPVTPCKLTLPLCPLLPGSHLPQG